MFLDLLVYAFLCLGVSKNAVSGVGPGIDSGFWPGFDSGVRILSGLFIRSIILLKL